MAQTKSKAKAPAKAPPKAPPRRGAAVEKKGNRTKVDSITWPVGEDGLPMAQISFTSSDLIPTGEYANVTIGPVTITKFIPASADAAKELNALADIVEGDVIAEQRELVMDQLQADAKSD